MKLLAKLLPFLILSSGLLCLSACVAENNAYTEEKLKLLVLDNTKKLAPEQASRLDAFWLATSSGVFQQCRSQYPNDKKSISLIIKNNLAGNVMQVWMLDGGEVGSCLVEYLKTATMPAPPFEPFFSPLYAEP